ncbi:MAG: hypothetical protein WBM08_08055 [Prochlorococcaceae cyanobacterium]
MWRRNTAPTLSACYRNRDGSYAADFTSRYRELCAHLGVTATRNNRGVAHLQQQPSPQRPQRAELRGLPPRAFRHCRNGISGSSALVDNLLLQDFQLPASNRCWAGDITSICTSDGCRQLAVSHR